MAKMFYTLEEAAEKLGCDESQVKQMVEEGTLQQYRDRDQVMYKVDEVDNVAGAGGAAAPSPAEPSPAGDESGGINIEGAPGGDQTDMIDLSEGDSGDTVAGQAEPAGDATGSGMNLSDSAVPGAEESEKTQVSDSFGGEASDASLDAIGSGSGLLDLTQESDDTSLGSVELLDDAPSDPGTAMGSDAKMGEGSDAVAGSSTGIFDAVGGGESSAAVEGTEPVGTEEEPEYAAVAYGGADAGEGFSSGVLAGTLVVLVIGVLVAAGGLMGTVTELTHALAEANYGMFYGIMAGMSVVLGLVGMFVFGRR